MSSSIWSPFLLSLKVAAMATLVVVVVGLPLSWLLARRRFAGRRLLAGLLSLPLVLPPTVLGLLLLVFLGPNGPIGAVLQRLGTPVVFHWSGAVIASAVAAFPLFLLPARSAIAGVDPALEDVARLLGRSEPAVLFLVTIPMAWRGLAAGAALTFARALGDFGATLMVAGNIPGRTQTAALAIFEGWQSGETRQALALTALVAAASILALFLMQAEAREEAQTS